MDTLLDDLQEPFPPDAITWKPGSTTKDGSKCMAMAYGDLRAYMKRLDEVCGLDWSCKYVAWGNERIMCELTISGVTRTSTGEFDAQDEKNNIEGTVAEAQAFKRACAMFGMGRYLYDLPSVWVGYDSGARKISKEGQAELDKRYRDWYRKTMAERQKKATQRVVVADTGEIVDSLPVATDEIFERDEHRPLASQSQLNHMHALGMDYYRTQENWDKARPGWALKASGDKFDSTKELSPEQVTWIIDLLKGRIAKRAQQPIATVA